MVAIGSSFGGTLFPIAARRLITEVGCANSLFTASTPLDSNQSRFPWTMRIIGFILLATLSITNLTLVRRLPPKDVSGPFFNLEAFRNPAYSVYCAAGFVTFLGLYTVSFGVAKSRLCDSRLGSGPHIY